MAKTKKMNEASFAKLVKELNALGELIRTRQDEKQAVINEFEKERKRFRAGNISKATMTSSIRKTNAEFLRLNKDIRRQIQKSNKIATNVKAFCSKQAPIVFNASLTGVNIKKTSKKAKKRKR